MDFLFFPRHFPAPFGAGEDRVHIKKEGSYVQANDDQAAIEGTPNRKQTVVLRRQPVRSFREKAPCKGERLQTAKRLWYSELYLSARRKG